MASSALFFLLVSAGVVLALPPPPGNKIIGGEIVDISTVPWQVALLIYGQHFGGGTIISTRWILTAAHCTYRRNATHLGVRVGSNMKASGGQYYEIDEVFNHEKYIHYSRDDISLLKTKTAIVLSAKVAIATLPHQNEAPPAIGETLKVSGWGRIDNTYGNRTDVLLATDIKVVDFSQCAETYNGKFRFNPDEDLQLCATAPGRGAHKGDSGGPLVRGNRVVGIVSYGKKPSGQNPAIYTKVSAYRGWINEKTGL